jgi:integrase
MRGQFQITSCIHGRSKYLVTGYTNGKRIRKFFRTKVQAEEFAGSKNIELQNFGHKLSACPDALRTEAITCAERLAPFGMTLTKVTDIWLGQNDWRTKSVLLKNGIVAYKAELDRKLDAKEISKGHHKNLRSIIKKLLPDFGETFICDLSPALLEKWMITQPVNATTRNNIRLNLGVFFNTFAVPKSWIAENPISKTTIANTKRLRKRPCIYTPEQAASILFHADDDLVPFFAIAMFAGLRTSEIEGLNWEDIDFEDRLIDVKFEISKTIQERFVPMSDNLIAWLSPYRGMQGPVVRQRLEWRRKAVRDRAGISAKDMRNAARHSYCSYRYALENDIGKCAKEAGNSPAVFLANYNRRVKEAPAKQYFAIFPQDAQNIIKVA